ncbi:MAG: COX15/CtaA family protein [Phycisphaerales bacterium]|nr:COX15/CtaA family protein [Phycisphaerales bacterium]
MTNQQLPDNGQSSILYKGVWGASITIGFASAACMWMIAWLLHMPGVQVASGIAIPVLMVPLFLITLFWTKNVAVANRLKIGVASGFLAGLINLLILGSNIVVQPNSTAEMSDQANTFAPNAIVVVLGSLILSTIIGLIASLAAGKQEPVTNASATTWRARFAWVTAITYLPLIAVGGAVTSTDSGLAVPDAVTTYGAISVLFPLELMAEPRIFLEHSHRLFGTLAGLTTLVLMIRVLLGENRKLPKVLTILLFLAVSIQGYMGIIRVAEESTFFAIIHGIFAQLVFAGALSTAIILSNSWTNAQPSEETITAAKRARLFMLLTVLALFIQLCLGAVTRHLNSGHAMMAHMGFSFIVLMLVIVGGALCMRAGKVDPSGKSIRPFGAILHGLVTLQLTLGFAVLGMAWEGDKAGALPTSENLADAAPIKTAAALITTAHHLIGALVLAAAAGALVWAIRLAIKPKIM